MKRKLDYIIESDDDCRLIFRFYPRSSSCHSFNEEAPKSWGEVYKVYYSWAILAQYFDDETGDVGYTKIVYKDECDECSMISEIAARCLHLAKGEEKVEVERRGNKRSIELLGTEIFPMGMGTSWKISKREYSLSNKSHISYHFEVWGWDQRGYRFVIPENRMEDFGEYLQMCCDYMLEHGEPI